MKEALDTALETFAQPQAGTPRAQSVAWCADHGGTNSVELNGLLTIGAKHVTELLRAACEHSIAVERLLEADEILPIPMMSLVRSIHEALLEVCWLADPYLSCETRLVRAAAASLAAVEGNVAPLDQLPNGAVELPRIRESVEGARALLEGLGFQLRYNKSGTQVVSVLYRGERAPLKVNVTELNLTYMPGTEHMWTLGSGGTHSRHWFTAGLEGSRDQICVMVVAPILDSCDYVMDHILGHVGLDATYFNIRTHQRRTALLLRQQTDRHRGEARAGYAEYDVARRGSASAGQSNGNS